MDNSKDNANDNDKDIGKDSNNTGEKDLGIKCIEGMLSAGWEAGEARPTLRMAKKLGTWNPMVTWKT